MIPAVYKRNKQNQQPLTITRGTSNTINVTLTDTEGETYTLGSGESLRLGIKMRPESEYVQLTKDIDSTALDEDVYVFSLTPEETANLRLGMSWYDVTLLTGDDIYPVIDLSPVTIIGTASDGE